jgi:hypothetical protein
MKRKSELEKAYSRKLRPLDIFKDLVSVPVWYIPVPVGRVCAIVDGRSDGGANATVRKFLQNFKLRMPLPENSNFC